MKKLNPFLLFFLACLFIIPSAAETNTDGNNLTWRTQDEQKQTLVYLYFFWSLDCPHCQDARSFIESLTRQFDWIKVHALEITSHRKHLQQYQQMARQLGQEARSVPAFFMCNSMWVGWDHEQGMGQTLVTAAHECLDHGVIDHTLTLPDPAFLSSLNLQRLSLPVFTMVIALLDAFNPCAFFVLLFLLSLLVHAQSRARMLLVGITFVVISGLIYFMFMAAWLNLFLLVGSMPLITAVAGSLALLIGVLNTREFFINKPQVSLSIPEKAKPDLFKRMGALLSTDRLALLILSTMILAIAVNGYELLCTAGFPMVYTRTLTLQQLDPSSYYLYLALYNVIYIIPLLVIVVLFTITLGRRKLSSQEGALLKLLSGMMMTFLGLILILAPEWLNHAFTGILLLIMALVVVGIVYIRQKRHTPTL